MLIRLTVEVLDDETCSRCGRSIPAGEKAFIRVWWPYKEAPSRDGNEILCEKCK